MTAAWPPGLPQAPMSEGWTVKRRSNQIATETAQGLERVRARFTGKFRDILVTLPPMTTAQKEAFDEFYDDTLESGTLEFDWYDFGTDPKSAATFMFTPKTTPDVSPIKPRKWNISFSLRQRL